MTDANQRHTNEPVDPIFLKRWSPRAYTGEALPLSDLMTILDAARWSPSASNNQPWRFVYGVAGTAAFERLSHLLVDGNRRWAEKAGALVFVISVNQTGSPGDDNRRPIPTHSFDAGAAWMALALQARMLGYFAHGMAGVRQDEIPVALNFTPNMKMEAAIAIGRMGESASLPDDLRSREVPSQRKPLSELAFEGWF